MDSSTWNWSEALKGYVLCRHCRNPIQYHGLSTDIWYHTELGLYCSPGMVPIPLLHNLNSADIVRMGYNHGILGAELSDNPYCPNNPLNDDANDIARSMEESSAWLRGWHTGRIQRRIERKLVDQGLEEPTKLKLDGLDWLEQERG